MKALALSLIFSSTMADPGFSCVNKETRIEEIIDYNDYVECGSKCTCSVFEIMCLIKVKEEADEDEKAVVVNNGFQLFHRSVEYLQKYCEAPFCLCNTMPNFSPLSFVVLGMTIRLGEPNYIKLPTYQQLSLQLPGTYEYNLAKQLSLETDDYRLFGHPFKEEITQSDLLRRVLDPHDWFEFIEGCIDPALLPKPEVVAEVDLETTDDLVEDTQDSKEDNDVDIADSFGGRRILAGEEDDSQISKADLLN